MTNIRFRYRFKIDNEIVTEVFTIEQIEMGVVLGYLKENKNEEKSIEILSRDRWTDQTDLKGRDIFQNDILRTKQGLLLKVVWLGVAGRFVTEYVSRPKESSIFYDKLKVTEWENQVEVIGTIYDTPEQGGEK